jgi:spore coat protein CotH
MRPSIAPLFCLLTCIASGPAQQKTNPGDAPYSPHEILDVQIRMAADDWRALRISHRSPDLSKIAESTYVYYKADVVIDGQTFRSVGVRKKGFFGSVVSTRPSLKIRFDRFDKKQKLHGLDQLTLNNNVQDPSQLHQYLAYWFFGRAGAHAPRCNFAKVTVNGEDLGVYSNVESIRKAFLARVFKSSKGDLYEGYAGDFTADDATFTRIVNKKGRPDSGRKPLSRLRDALTRTPISLDAIEELIDVDEFITFWTTEVLIGHWDSYSGNRNNYYVFRDKATKRFHFIPWGADSIFQDPGPFIRQPVPRSLKAVGILSRRLWDIPKVRTKYRKEMRRLLRDVFVEDEVLAEIKTITELLQPHLTISKDAFRSRIETARSFITTRRKQIEPELEQMELTWPDLGGALTPPKNPTMMKMSGTFVTTMTREPTAGEAGEKTSMTVAVAGGEKILFTGVRASAQLDDPRFIRPGYPVVRLSGTHPSSKKLWHLAFYIDPVRLALGPKVAIDHFAVWAMVIEGSPMSPTAKRQIFGVSGELTVDQLEQKIGAKVSGSFRLSSMAFQK